VIEPRKETDCGADTIFRVEGSIGVPRMGEVARDPPGSVSGACKQGIYRNLGALVLSPINSTLQGRRLRK